MASSSSFPPTSSMAFLAVVSRRLMVIHIIIVSFDLRYKVIGCYDEERRALLEIKKVFNSADGSALLDWGHPTTKEGKDCCQWHRITCNSITGHVVEINLYFTVRRAMDETWRPNLTMLAEFKQLERLNLGLNNIEGDIPEVICNLKLLKSLDLSVNSLQGSIPSCLCTLRLLRKLDLFYNNLKGSIPSCLCNLRSLRKFDLSMNNLEGFIPSCLCTIRSLRELDLAYNSLGGHIPSCFGNFHSLAALDLYGNQLQGNYSSWLCNLVSLTYLSLSSDKFSRNIPSCLGNLNKLESLQLGGDGFRGSIPPSIFSNLTYLSFLFIYGGGLEGTLQFAQFANVSKLEVIHISSNGDLEIDTQYPISWIPSFQLRIFGIYDCMVNRLSGNRLPTFLWTQERLENLFFQGTSLKGTPPIGLFCNSTLSDLDLSRNKFSSPFPLPCHNATQNVRTIDLSYNDLHGSLSENIAFSFPMLRIFKLAGNELEGPIPMSLGLAPLFLLDLSDNILTGSLPHTIIGNNTNLSYLNVSYNHLNGEMLPVDADMPMLTYLIINNNNFIGSFLQKLSNSSSLSFIDAGYNGFTDKFSHNLPYFPELIILRLRENHIEGNLPKELCQMQYLRSLDLSGNKLSGNILPCFHNISSWRSIRAKKGILYTTSYQPELRVLFTSKNLVSPYEGNPLKEMTLLDLSLNKISSVIPQEIGDLKGLRTLNLSNNQLQGFIPEAMASMDTMECLDISHNGLSGSIPNKMVRLSSLSNFTVAFNNLSGMIPSGGQFGTFSEISYKGNPGLCGPPLKKACPFDKERGKKMTKDGEMKGKSKGLDDYLFYSLVTLSFIFGFWGFLASVFCNINWRMRYFKTIDEYYSMYLRDL